MSDYDWGVYVLGMYASAAGVSQGDVISAYKLRYGGPDAVSAVGSMARSLQVGMLQQQMQAIADQTPGSTTLSQADVNQALITLGATLPPVSAMAAAAVQQTASQVGSAAETVATAGLSLSKYALVAVAILGGAYLVFEAKHAL